MSEQAKQPAEPTEVQAENGLGHADIPPEVPVPVHAEKDESATTATKPKASKTNGSAPTSNVKKASSTTCLMLNLT